MASTRRLVWSTSRSRLDSWYSTPPIKPSMARASPSGDQRSFNAAVLRLVDDLQDQVARLEAELEAERAKTGSK